MSKTTDSLEFFYQYAEDNDCLYDELNMILTNDKTKKEFFELCKKFEDIPLNADKYIGDEPGVISACFKFSNIALAKEAAKSFYVLYHIKNVDAYIESIHKLYPQAVEQDDDRQKCGMIRNEDINYSLGYYGAYFNFQELPRDEWDRISKELKEYLITP